MVFAQIGMGQAEIAQRLRVAQARAVAQHQPSVGAQDGDVVSGGFGIRRTNPDVHQGDPVPIGPLQMIGRHLRRFGRRRQHPVARGDGGIAARDKGRVAKRRVRQGRTRHEFKLVHIELIVGEQHIVLKMDRIGRRVMRQARERIINPLCRERG